MHCKPHFGFILWVLLATSLAPFLSIFKGLKTISRNHQTCQFLLLSRLSLCYRILSSWGKSCILCTVIKARMKHQSESVSSVHFSCSVVSDSLQTHEPEQARPPCLSPTPRVYPNSCPLSHWWHPTISSSVVPFSSCPQSFPACVFSNESALRIRWPEYWSFSFGIIPSNEHPGLISFKMDWLDLLAVQGTLKSLLQNHSSKASILWCSAFFIVQLLIIHTWPLEKP